MVAEGVRRVLEAPTDLVRDGRISFGTYAEPIPNPNLIDAQPWGLPVPRALRALRLKEWQAFQFANRRYFFVVALFDAKVMGLVQIKAYDRQQKRKYVFERKLPGWSLRPAGNLLDSTFAHSGLRFVNDLRHDRIDIDIDVPAGPQMPALKGSLRILAAGCEPEVVCIPFAENRGMYSHKCCMGIEGELRMGDERLHFSDGDSFALIDDHKGYYAWVMRWDGVTGAGFDPQGRRIGFNLTKNASVDPQGYNENCLWIDGRRHLLPPVRFRRRPELTPEVWEIRDDDGAVEVDFVIEVDGRVRVNALLLESRYRGPFGHFRGRLRGPEGAEVAVDDFFGMGEDFYLRC